MYKKKTRKLLSFLLTLALLIPLCQGIMPERVAEAATVLNNPMIDSSGVTTWDCVYFGNYWQEDTNGDGKADKNDAKTPIKWRVLSVDGDDAFLLADKNLDGQKYNSTYTDVTWETCTMRSWLNGYGAEVNKDSADYRSNNFLRNAFSKSEQSAIKLTNVVNSDNPKYDTEGGNDTSDNVYLLSIDEVTNPEYGFTSNEDATKTREAVNTAYVADGGEAITGIRSGAGRTDSWWLRSPGGSSFYASDVDSLGFVNFVKQYGIDVRNGIAVRPALHLNLSSSSWSYAGTVTSKGGVDETGVTEQGKPSTLPTVTPGESTGKLKNPTTDADGVTTWDCVWFGNYWQEDTNGDGKADKNDAKTPIKWRVLSVNGDDAFLLADKNLDCQRYNDTYTDVTWETCTMRSWLNGYGAGSNVCENDYTGDNFLDNAFSASEQSVIKNTTVINADNPEYGTEGGNDTTDKVYLLSINEVLNSSYGFTSDYSEYAESRWAHNTAYAKAQGAWTSTSAEYAGNVHWWLRSPGDYCNDALIVSDGGYVSRTGFYVNQNYCAVRPALHLNLSSTSSWSYAGTVTSEGGVDEQGTPAPAESETPKPWDLPTLLPDASEEPVSTDSPKPSMFNEYIFRADHLTDPSEVEGATMENSFINADTPSEILVRGLQENGFAGTADAWRAVTRTCEAASDASKIVDYVMEEKDIYEALIFNIFESVSKNDAIDALNTSAIKDTSQLFGIIKEDFKTKYMLDVTEDMKTSNFTPEMKERTRELAEEYFSKKGISKAADWLKKTADVMKALNTAESLCEEIAAYTNIRNMSDSMKTVLKEMKKKCPSDNRALSAALDDCVKVMEASEEEFEHQIMHGRMKVVGKDAAKVGISKFWSSVVTGKIKTLCPEAAIVKAAYETSKYITNFMFNTDEITEKYYKMLAFTELYSVLRDTYASIKDTYTAGKTVDCAEDYLSVVDVIFCALRVDCDCAYEYVDSLDSSNMNKFCGLFGCDSDASELKETIENIKSNYYEEYELVLTSWVHYLDEDFPAEYENYKHLVDESMERVKEYRIHCPVDVRVYDSSGRMAASVVNDIPDSSGITVLVDGDSKTFYLTEGETYSFTYTGNDTGSMDIQIAEYEADGTLLRTANFNNLSLAKGINYYSNDNGKFLEKAEYYIIDSENKRREADFDSDSQDEKATCIISVEQGMILRNGLSDWTVKAGKNEILDLSAYVPEGYEFDTWQVLSGDIQIRNISSAETEAVAGDMDAVVKAVIREKKEEDNTPLPTVKPTALPNVNHTGTSSGVQQPTGNVGAAKSVPALGKPVIKSVKNTKGRKIKITLTKKVQGAAGYQVQYALNKKFTKAKKSKDVGKWTSVKTITGLMKGKTYYVRVRAYKKVSGKKSYGKWSKTKKVKITK